MVAVYPLGKSAAVEWWICSVYTNNAVDWVEECTKLGIVSTSFEQKIITHISKKYSSTLYVFICQIQLLAERQTKALKSTVFKTRISVESVQITLFFKMPFLTVLSTFDTGKKSFHLYNVYHYMI